MLADALGRPAVLLDHCAVVEQRLAHGLGAGLAPGRDLACFPHPARQLFPGERVFALPKHRKQERIRFLDSLFRGVHELGLDPVPLADVAVLRFGREWLQRRMAHSR